MADDLVVARLDPHAARRRLDAHLAAGDDAVQATVVPEVREIGAVRAKALGRRLEVVRLREREEAPPRRSYGSCRGPSRERAPNIVEVVVRLVVGATLVEPAGEPVTREDAIGRERDAAVGDAVADVGERAAARERDTLARLAADGARLAVEEHRAPAGRGRLEAVRDHLRRHPFPLEHGQDQLAKAGRDDERVVRRDELRKPGSDRHGLEQPLEHLVERSA